MIFVKVSVFLPFTKNMSKNLGKNLCKSFTGKYSQELLDHAKQSATDGLQTPLKKAIQNRAKDTGDLTGNKLADKITKVLRTSPQNNSETVAKKGKIMDLIEKYLEKDFYL